MTRTRYLGTLAALAFVATVWLANLAIARWGPVPVGFGLVAPAGVYFAGAAFLLRDVVHRTLGVGAVLVAIVAGATLSLAIEDGQRLALASAVAFTVSELADLSVYAPFRRRGWLVAVVASNAVGIVVDSILFLWIAFGSLAYLRGQVVGKATVTVVAVVVLLALERRLRVAAAV